jgi:alginate O-acetyltransferase complex protein AlgI
VFVLSGLVHELVITVPAAAGYGGPTLFFAAQAGGLFIERSRFGRKIGLGRGATGWLFTMLVLATPLTLLFPPPFLTKIIVPMLRALEAS